MLTAQDRASSLLDRFRQTRSFTEEICRPLEPEDTVIQSMPDASPPKWHLGHTTWFFEKFLLEGFQDAYQPFHPEFNFLFNSYYESVGKRQPRPQRGLLARPPIRKVYDYRLETDRRLQELSGRLEGEALGRFLELLEIGIHHEQQHQELLFTDIKYNFASNPVWPPYLSEGDASRPLGAPPEDLRFREVEGGIHVIGFEEKDRENRFAYDNEKPAHRVYLNDFRIANRPVTNGEYAAFIEDGGYQEFRHWLSDGWARRTTEGWEAPLYWRRIGGAWMHFTLHGLQEIDPAAPVAHLSYYEALAFAHWAGKRLPTEAEWEVAAARFGGDPSIGNFARSNAALAPLASGHPHHPQSSGENGSSPEAAPMRQAFGDVWEWTGSAYLPYPGYQPMDGALGEYNGKFMSDQMVLRGGSCVTPEGHARLTYRNFFQPFQRWQFSGVRLAEDA